MTPRRKTPLGTLVSRDLPHRLIQTRALPSDTVRDAVTRAQQKWTKLLEANSAQMRRSLASISDPRVDPLTQSTWDQATADDDGKTACYNYYTPPYNTPGNPDNDYCGCVATAMAQLMRYWQYPTLGVGTGPYSIKITGQLRGGDGNGGPYQWANMPLSPETGTPTAQCQAIGALCSDAGVAVCMNYNSDASIGSSASAINVAPALKKIFQYENVIFAYTNNWQDITANLSAIVNPNLDAGFPVIFSIHGSSGHEIVCDGYGYDNTTLYHHLNLGWSGAATAWYNLPYIVTQYDFTVINGCDYNIYPSGSGEVISGRVLNGDTPVAGALVTAVGGSITYPTVTTNARGIYAVAKLASATSYTLTATKTGLPTCSIAETTGNSVTSPLYGGNIWGADINFVSPAPHLLLTKSCNSFCAQIGATLTYTLTYGNMGDGTANNVLLTDVLPANVSYVPNSASAGGSYANGVLSWSLASLPSTQLGSVTYQVLIAPSAPLDNYINNTASITATEISPPVNSNTVSVYITTNAVTTNARGDWWMFHHDLAHTGLSAFTVPATAVQLWTFSTRGIIYSSPAIGADGTIYVGSMDGNLYAINPDSTEKWAFYTGNWINSSPAIGTDGTIYIGSGDWNLYAIKPDGTEKWAFLTGNSIEASPALGADGTIYVGSDDAKLYAINPNGTTLWVFTTNDQIKSSPALGTDGTIYVGSEDDNLYAINQDGTPVPGSWPYKTGGEIESSPAIGADGTIYVGSDDDNLYAINPDGTPVPGSWPYKTGGEIVSSPAIGANGTIYIGSEDHKLYAINPDGTEKWAFRTGNSINSSPAIGADGTVYVGSQDYKFCAVNPNDSPQWVISTGGGMYSSPAIGANGTIYIGAEDHNLYAFGLRPPAPVITSFTPGSGGAGTTVSLTGMNFVGSSAVTVGGTAADSFTLLDSTTICVTVGNGATGTIAITTPGGTAASSGSFTFIPMPAIASFTPTTGSTGTVVSISGANFSGAFAVAFGGTAAASFTIVNATTISATVGNGASGPITVTTPGGTATSAAIYCLPPTITSIKPSSEGTGMDLIITGSNFIGATGVAFSGMAAASFTVYNDTTITATMDSDSPGTITVTTPGGTATSVATYYPLPTITSFTPSSGGTGTSLSITGTNFIRGNRGGDWRHGRDIFHRRQRRFDHRDSGQRHHGCHHRHYAGRHGDQFRNLHLYPRPPGGFQRGLANRDQRSDGLRRRVEVGRELGGGAE